MLCRRVAPVEASRGAVHVRAVLQLGARRTPNTGTYQPLSGNPKTCVELAAGYLNEVAAAHLGGG